MSRSASNEAVVAVNDIEGPSVARLENGRTVVGGRMRLLRER